MSLQVRSAAIFPAAGYFDILAGGLRLSAGDSGHGLVEASAATGSAMPQPFVLPKQLAESASQRLQFECRRHSGAVRVSSKHYDGHVGKLHHHLFASVARCNPIISTPSSLKQPRVAALVPAAGPPLHRAVHGVVCPLPPVKDTAMILRPTVLDACLHLSSQQEQPGSHPKELTTRIPVTIAALTLCPIPDEGGTASSAPSGSRDFHGITNISLAGDLPRHVRVDGLGSRPLTSTTALPDASAAAFAASPLLSVLWNAKLVAEHGANHTPTGQPSLLCKASHAWTTTAALLHAVVGPWMSNITVQSSGAAAAVPCASPMPRKAFEPQYGALSGMIRTAAMEVRGFLSSHLDTDPLTRQSTLGRTLAFSLHNGIMQPSADAVRAGVRLTQALAPSSTPARPAAHLTHSPSGLHTLVTGGTGILGSLVAGWLRRIGDRHQQLLGRSGKVSPAMLDALCLPGPQPHLLSVTLCDVSASEEVLGLVRQRDGSQLQGVMHAGGVLSDATIHKQTVQRFRQVFAPKVCGMCQPRASWSSAAVQHQVLFSSIAALYGSPGQLNYSGANSVLDAMAHAQRMMGVGVVSIQWGAWGGSGMAMRDSGTARRMGRMGIGMLGAVDGLQALGGILGTDRGPRLAVTPMVWERFIKQEFGFPAGFLKEFETDSALQTPADSQVLPADSPAPASKFEMPTAPPDHTLVASASTATAVREAVEEAVSGILGTSVGATDPLAAAGLDSLGAVELRNSMEERLGLALPATLLFDYPTVEDLVAHLGAALPSARAQTSSGAPPPSQPGAVGAEEVQQQVVEAVSAILGSGVDMTQPLVAAGVDSLGAVELRNNLEERLGCQLPATLLFDFPTVTDLSAHLHKTMADHTKAKKAKSAPTVDMPSIPRLRVSSKEGVQGRTVAIASLQSTATRLPYNVIQKACAQDMVGVVPRGRWDVDGHNARREAASTGNRFAVWLEGVAHFDGAAFQVPDAEAVLMDPQQRLLLETGWEALEGACDPVGSSCGVYVGIWHADYHEMIQDAASMMGGSYVAYHATGTNASVSAGRLSYTFGLKGPSMSLDTACSASLVAMHLAFSSFALRQATESLVCGVSLLLSPSETDVLVSAQMLSACGRCQTLDAAADGYGRGEACIAFLARLWGGTPGQGAALVRGTAVNQDGRSSSLTAPNGPAQQAVAQSAWDAARAPVADMRALQASLPSLHTVSYYPGLAPTPSLCPVLPSCPPPCLARLPCPATTK